ncbi:sigma-70 family RNA polymerase sigma factor [Enhygromyxa salina]|uniref:RNA polymerase sigma factor n=1 Tax=Enhygromyxa salina TaxID=215803 RepID=A0A2S9YVK4_9BACT|nr:sigma-70 family RNA polymerase sigma factor [Enhygromyxa salina]PRQ09110.1 RNA polymerase sigma factor [Enhygromyxa salina]
MREPDTDRATSLVTAAIERWPTLTTRRSELVELVRPEIDSAAREQGPEELDCLRPDLVLACALAAGDAAALAVFEAEFIPQLEGALRRAGIASATIDDALQVVRFRLLVPTEARAARIASYRGRSSLQRWLSVVAVREARSLARRVRPTSDLEVAEAVTAQAADLETDFHIREHRAAFTRALTTAFAELSAKQRLLMRLDVLDGLSDGEIAKIYAVHRTTALRWVERATTELIVATKRHLARELALEGAELDSLVRGLVSRLDLSLGRILVESADPSAAPPGISL